MGQEGLSSSDPALKEWYSTYMGMTEVDAHQSLRSMRLEPRDVKAFLAEVSEAMREVRVIDRFCGTCQAMIDNWPDFKCELDKGPLEHTMERLPRFEEMKNSTTFPISQHHAEGPRIWGHLLNGMTADLPCQDGLVRRRAAAENGCRGCHLIIGIIEDDYFLDDYIKGDRMLKRLRKSSNIHVTISFNPMPKWTECDARSKMHTLHVSLPGRGPIKSDSTSRVCFRSFPVINQLPPSFSLQNKKAPFAQTSPIELAKYWTRTCLESHEQCNLDRPSQYPTRLLSIGRNSTRLVTTTGWARRPQYATLSHCWGSQEFETLRSNNLQQMHRCIPKKLLTETFKDAIDIARTVGLHYLWIDSWCIIQDKHKDWEVEAARMASVYGGSSLNIAASSASSGTKGCFPRPRKVSRGFQAEVCIGGRNETHHFVTPGLYSQSVYDNPLASRAWALQEKVLSPRTLHCSDKGIFWECRTTMASEDFPDGLDGSGADNFIRRSLRESLILLPDGIDDFSWKAIVERYSQCKLTYSRDKLVALSGIASLMGDRSRDEYFAGIFGKNIEINLCWKAQDPQPKPPYRAPSWSWAAVDGHIRHRLFNHYDSNELYAHVRAISVENTGSDPCGAVARGTLVLDCDITRQGTVSGSWPRSTMREDSAQNLLGADLGYGDRLFPFGLDCAEEHDDWLGQAISYVPIVAGETPHIHFEDLVESEEKRIRSEESDFEEDKFNEISRDIFGLVIKEVVGQGDECKRIGYFEYSSCERCDKIRNDSARGFFSDFMQLISTGSPRVCKINLV